MQVIKYAFGVVVLTAAIMAGVSKPVEATAKCEVVGTKLGQWGSTFTVNGDQITSTFKVKGPKDCFKVPATLAVWEAPAADGHPIEEQELFSYKTGHFGPGTHQLTSTLPVDCFYQADLVQSASPTAADGGANYMWQNGQFVDGGLKDHKYGGKQVCEDPEDPEEPEQPEEPETPVTPETPTPQVKAVQTPSPSKLPSTGPAAIATTFFGVSGLAGLAHAIFRRFRG